MPIRLALADDQQLFIEGMRLLLASFPGVELIHEARNGQELLDACAQDLPDVVLLDIKMPVMDGIEATRRLRQRYPDLRILLLTMHDNARLITHLMDLGANGYLLKNESPENVRTAIETVMEKEYYFNDYVSKALLNQVQSRRRPVKTDFAEIRRPELSRRETEVLELICRQYTTAEIAKALFITPRTVEGHRRNLFDKTGVKNVAGLVIFALRHRLVELPE